MQFSLCWPHQAVCVVFKQTKANKQISAWLPYKLDQISGKNEDKLCYFNKADVSSGCHCLGTNAFYSSYPIHCNDMSNIISFEEQSVDAYSKTKQKRNGISYHVCQRCNTFYNKCMTSFIKTSNCKICIRDIIYSYVISSLIN